MPKDYYLTLGITSEATLNDIKDAYRRLAKAYHPDRYKGKNSLFLAIQEAYSVLSDPVKRQTHDLSIRNQEKKQRYPYSGGLRPGPVRSVEPLIPESRPMVDLRTTRSSGNYTVRVSLDTYGIRNRYLTVYFHIHQLL
jgi:molecular chaperone DnaJ